MTFKQMDKILRKDGWRVKSVRGSHYQYVHSIKPGKVTIPRHGGDLSCETVKRIYEQAGLK